MSAPASDPIERNVNKKDQEDRHNRQSNLSFSEQLRFFIGAEWISHFVSIPKVLIRDFRELYSNIQTAKTAKLSNPIPIYHEKSPVWTAFWN